MMGLAGCNKNRNIFAFTFAVFQSQSIVEILLLPHLENKRALYGNSTSGFDFELFIVIGMKFCTDVTILSQLDGH